MKIGSQYLISGALMLADIPTSVGSVSAETDFRPPPYMITDPGTSVLAGTFKDCQGALGFIDRTSNVVIDSEVRENRLVSWSRSSWNCQSQ
ncbi:hypothetical protein Mpal_0061 [Methanosphaerula palustris E1-9c]|uniref:Uncharacterized protein n=1 Tax=Methanosphaerula palustris (strain ATCC BAA-1556 / DSM 19958 / E1-9c) TaxID=521011 RepID=B8GIA4_METPE|nr:hypothetical protein Mpal_0061 [Methanosphaerula palustris E1-9c]